MRALTIFIVFSISAFEIINGIVHFAKYKGCPKPQIFFWIAVSVADANAVDPSGIKTLLVEGMSTFINDKPTFINRPRTLPRTRPSRFLIFSVVPFSKMF